MAVRARVVFYGAALLIVADLGVNWYGGAPACRCSRSSACSSAAGSPCGAPGGTSTPRLDALRTRGPTPRPSAVEAASRIVTCWPTKIGVSRSV